MNDAEFNEMWRNRLLVGIVVLLIVLAVVGAFVTGGME